MTERERTEAMLAENNSYRGPDMSGALMGSIDCEIELLILDEVDQSQ